MERKKAFADKLKKNDKISTSLRQKRKSLIQKERKQDSYKPVENRTFNTAPIDGMQRICECLEVDVDIYIYIYIFTFLLCDCVLFFVLFPIVLCFLCSSVVLLSCCFLCFIASEELPALKRQRYRVVDNNQVMIFI